MSRPYRAFVRDVAYWCPLDEAALLARTTQRRLGLSKLQAQRGVPVVVATYGLPRTPLADAILTSVAWYPAACGVPWAWLHG